MEGHNQEHLKLEVLQCDEVVEGVGEEAVEGVWKCKK